MILGGCDKAKWIWFDEECINQYVDFRSEFTLDKFENVVLFISADSRYQVFVNGVSLPMSQFADFPHYKVYDEENITEFVRCGKNILTIIGHFQGEDSSVYLKGSAGVLFAIKADNNEVLSSNGDGVKCRQSLEYVAGEMERFSPQLSFSFKYNAKKYDNWHSADYSPSVENGWADAIETGIDSSQNLFSRPIKPLRFLPPCDSAIVSQGVFLDKLSDEAFAGDKIQKSFMSFRTPYDLGVGNADFQKLPIHLPNTIEFMCDTDQCDGIYVVVDLHSEQAGLFSMDIDAFEETKILIGFGEHLDDLRVRASVGNRQFAAVYNTKKGRQTFLYHMKRFGCRYLQLHFYTNKIKIHYIGLTPTPYPVVYKPRFICNDHLHNKIFEVSRTTLELCMHEHYEDCPWREQALYAMDSRNQMLCGYYVFEEYEFAQSSLRLFALSQRADGLLELCAPAKVAITIPAFSLSYITAVYENLLFSGDKQFAFEMLPVAEKIITVFLNRREDNGLISNFLTSEYWNFYEWQPGLDGDSIYFDGIKKKTFDAPLNGFLALALLDLSKFYTVMEMHDKSNEMYNYYKQLKTSLMQFWDEKKQLFKTFLGSDSDEKSNHYCELTQSILMCAEVGSRDMHLLMLENIKTKQNLLIEATLSTTLFKYQAFMKYPDKYAVWVGDEIARIWGHMLFSGATSFWETIKGAWDFDSAGSLCHGWASIPIYFYYKFGLGISPENVKNNPVFMGLYDARLASEQDI